MAGPAAGGGLLAASFAIPVLVYMTYSAAVLHDRFELSDQGDAVLYGRVAAAADCATLRIPAAERAVCPSPRIAASFGVDELVNNPDSPAYTAPLPAGISHADADKRFSYAVLEQQPLRVAGPIAKDAVKLFALTRDTAPGDTPIWRWQFQTTYPTFPADDHGCRPRPRCSGARGGGAPVAVRPLAAFLRGLSAARRLHARAVPAPVVAGRDRRSGWLCRRRNATGRAGLPADHRRGRGRCFSGPTSMSSPGATSSRPW